MKQYLDALKDVWENGTKQDDRTGDGTISKFNVQMNFDLTKGIPILTTKKIGISNIVAELEWFIKGQTNVYYLMKEGCNIWNKDLYRHYLEGYEGKYPESEESFINRRKKFAKSGRIVTIEEKELYDSMELGKIYGYQWRHPDNDQLVNLIKGIMKNPGSRRHILNAWNPTDIKDMALPPCHMMLQLYVRDGKYLDGTMYQRSGDMFLGVPYNITSYAILIDMIAEITGYEPGMFNHIIGDAHIYNSHKEQVEEQLKRKPLPLTGEELLVNYNFKLGNDGVLQTPVSIKRTLNKIKISYSSLEYKNLGVIKAPLIVGTEGTCTK